MVKYSLPLLIVMVCVAYVISAPVGEEDRVEVDSEVVDIQPAETKKIKRGIYSGYGYGSGSGYYPYYTYSFAPIYKSYGYGGGLGRGGYGYYPYYSLGYSGYGYGHGGYGHYW